MKRFLLITTLCLLFLPLASCGKDTKNINDTVPVPEKSEDIRLKMKKDFWYEEIKAEDHYRDENIKDNDNIEDEEGHYDDFEGEYSGVYDSQIQIKKNIDNTYHIIMNVSGLVFLYHCEGIRRDDTIEFSTTEIPGNELKGILSFEPIRKDGPDECLMVTFLEGSELGDILSKHKSLRYYSVPNMDIEWGKNDNNSINGDNYEGTYFDYNYDDYAMGIKKNKDDTYTIEIKDEWIDIRNCIGKLKGNKIEFSTWELLEEETKGVIEFERDITTLTAKVTFFKESEWGNFFSNYGALEYYKILDTPPDLKEISNYAHKEQININKSDKYEGKYLIKYEFDDDYLWKPSVSTHMEIQKNKNGTYKIYIFDTLCYLTGIETKNGIEFSSTESADSSHEKIKGTLTFEDNLTVKIEFSDEPDIDEDYKGITEYCMKSSHIPNMDLEEYYGYPIE